MNLAAVHGFLRSLAVAVDAVRGAPVRRGSADRALLEETILPAYAARADVRRLLFVGCARYTRHYAQLFDHIEYWTLDPVPSNRRWGAGHRHIEDRLEQLDRHAAPGAFDVIVCNGVLGWGLNRRDDVERAFAACGHALRQGGELVIGWNDVAPRNRVPPATVRALRALALHHAPGIGGPVLRVEAPHRHVFEFYRKPPPGHAVSVVTASGAGAHADSGRQAPAAQSS